MNEDSPSIVRKGFCIFIHSACEGRVPSVSDQDGYCVFETELEAQKEIVDDHMTRLQQFLDGEREYEDAITIDEYVVPVVVNADGTISDENGNSFRSRPD